MRHARSYSSLGVVMNIIAQIELLVSTLAYILDLAKGLGDIQKTAAIYGPLSFA